MSDILIKGLKMPKNYPYRLTIHSDGHVEEHTGYSGHGHYQAIELQPHGRLIDADKLKQDNPSHMEADVPYVTEVTVEEIIDNAPTVLEANYE